MEDEEDEEERANTDVVSPLERKAEHRRRVCLTSKDKVESKKVKRRRRKEKNGERDINYNQNANFWFCV